MTAYSSNIAASYWAFKDVNYSSEGNSLKNAMQTRVDNLVISIKDLLSDNSHSISESFSKLFNDIFSLRIESINLINSKDLNVEKIFDSIYEDFVNREIPEKYDLLNENVLFSIRTTSKIANNILSNNDSPIIIKSLEDFAKLSDSSDDNLTIKKPYTNLVKSIKLISHQFPNSSLLQLIELTNNSLITELGIISADIIFDNYNELKFPKTKISELNEIIVEATQEYGALALELGLVQKNKKTTSQVNSDTIDSEDQILAELGLSEFLNNIDSSDK